MCNEWCVMCDILCVRCDGRRTLEPEEDSNSLGKLQEEPVSVKPPHESYTIHLHQVPGLHLPQRRAHKLLELLRSGTGRVLADFDSRNYHELSCSMVIMHADFNEAAPANKTITTPRQQCAIAS